MENILSMVAEPKPTEIASCDQIDQDILQEFLAKTSVWDVYEITREEYMNKSNNDKENIIVKFFIYMSAGKLLLFVSLLLGVFPLFLLFEFCISRVHEHANECWCS